MKYQMEIMSTESLTVLNNETKKFVTLDVGGKYIFEMSKPTRIKDRTNNGRIVEVIGFSDTFCGDVIVRYMDTRRRGRLSPAYLTSYEFPSNEQIRIVKKQTPTHE